MVGVPIGTPVLVLMVFYTYKLNHIAGLINVLLSVVIIAVGALYTDNSVEFDMYRHPSCHDKDFLIGHGAAHFFSFLILLNFSLTARAWKAEKQKVM